MAADINPLLKLLLIELNEVNEELLGIAAEQLSLQSIRQVLGMCYSQTSTVDTYESDYLEPWSQWVSIHTGMAAAQHKIKHLGDIVNLKTEQLWETLSRHGIESGIWGVMNGRRGNAHNCRFFLSDPWTWDAAAYPQGLSDLTNLAVYIAKNYLSLSKIELLRHGLSYGWGILRYLTPAELMAACGILLDGMISFGPCNLVLGAFFEYVSAACFIKTYRKHQPGFGILFLNLLAHTQHHYWPDKNKLTPQLKYAFRAIDGIIGKVLAQAQTSDVLLFANAFSQVNTAHEPAWILYRAHDPLAMLRNIGINPVRAEPLMTHDIHIWLSTPEDREQVQQILESATVADKKLFFVEADQADGRKLFFRLQFTETLPPGETFTVQDRSYRFDKFFKVVVRRTGKHHPQGFALQSSRIMPEKLANHEIHQHICRFFKVPYAEAEHAAPTVPSMVVA